MFALEQGMFKDEMTGPAAPKVSADDATLVMASKTGDSAAFEELVARYDRKLFRIAYNIFSQSR
jgi:hypothetical protein